MSPLAALAPAWIGFEVLQLVLCERYLGIRQIQVGKDPRQEGPHQAIAFSCVALTVLYWAWMVGMLVAHIGMVQVVALMVVSLCGHTIRRVCGLRWVLVVLTFEGAIRIGMLVSLTLILFRAL